MNEHTAVNNSLTVRRWLRKFVIDDWHIIWDFVVGLLQIHLAGELFANLIKGLSGPVSKPVQHTPLT